METTAAALKKLLGEHFGPGVEHIAQQSRRAGLIPAGAAGYGGCRSALLEPLHAVSLILACGPPRDAAEAARTLGSYVLKAVFLPTVGPAFRQNVRSTLTFASWAAGELARVAAYPDTDTRGWEIQVPCWLLTYAEAERQDPPPRLRLVPDQPDMLFEPLDPPEVRARPVPAAQRLVAIVEPALIRAVASLFAAREPVRPSTLSALLADTADVRGDAVETPPDSVGLLSGVPCPRNPPARPCEPPMSRPYVTFDPDIAQRICHELSAGKSLRQICAAPDMPDRHTVRRWVADPANAAFREAYDAARLAWADELFEQIAELGEEARRAAEEADAKGHNSNAAVSAIREEIRAKMWVCARLRPDKYGDRVSAEITGAGGKDLIPGHAADPARLAQALLLAFETLPMPEMDAEAASPTGLSGISCAAGRLNRSGHG